MKRERMRYAILKMVEEKKHPLFVISSDCATKVEINNEVAFLIREGYIENNVYSSHKIVYRGHLTRKGEGYLENNKALLRAYSVAQELNEMIIFLQG
ncbi:hypothetical protein [Lactococcus fujiensis]|nr:hypothetical protein [Lactococcus fujiensis]